MTSVKDALSSISLPQPIQVARSNQPGQMANASQQVMIEALPLILVLHLKRFLYDIKLGAVAKIGKQVSFSAELEIGTDILAGSRKSVGAKYRLYGGKLFISSCHISLRIG